MRNTTEVSLAERRAILQGVIAKFVRQGYRVVSQTDTTAQLVRPKRFSLLWAALWFLFFGIGLLVYLIYYMAKRDSQIYLGVDAYGKVIRR